MRAHLHLVLETPNANPVSGIRSLRSVCIIRLNHRPQVSKHVLSGRSKAPMVDGIGTGFLRTASDHVHLKLARRRKADPEKLAIAARLRNELPLTMPRIGEPMYLGTFRSAHLRLHKWVTSEARSGT